MTIYLFTWLSESQEAGLLIYSTAQILRYTESIPTLHSHNYAEKMPSMLSILKHTQKSVTTEAKILALDFGDLGPDTLDYICA